MNLDDLSFEELASLRADKRRELAKLERQDREKRREHRMLSSVLHDLENMDKLEWNELVNLRNKLLRVREIIVADLPFDRYALLACDENIAIVATVIELRQQVEQVARQIQRHERIQARRAADNNKPAQEESNLCVVCNKRLRHFGDYCKRCVPDTERPKGKV